MFPDRHLYELVLLVGSSVLAAFLQSFHLLLLLLLPPTPRIPVAAVFNINTMRWN